MLRRHVIIETNKTTARIFPEVPDCETPEFWDHMEKLIVLNKCATSVLCCFLCGAGPMFMQCNALRWQAPALHSARQCGGSACVQLALALGVKQCLSAEEFPSPPAV